MFPPSQPREWKLLSPAYQSRHREIQDPRDPGRWHSPGMVLAPEGTKRSSGPCPLSTALRAEGQRGLVRQWADRDFLFQRMNL